jgi:ATP-dependent helicase/nuclease subunit B
MKKSSPRVFTIAPGKRFLPILADAIKNSSLLFEHTKTRPLSDWTILLPTRRAARELTNILAESFGGKSTLMPIIKPIGDLDEENLNNEAGDLPVAISPIAQIFILLDLLKQWANENPLVKLAQEISVSPAQSFSLALSLQQLVNQIETEETNLDRLSDVYHEDLSEHRNAILSLIGLVKIALPQRLYAERKFGQAERRSRMLRLKSEDISAGRFKGPIIAAGSTGTIPATRALLKAIAEHPQGAVILPGLDQHCDEETWQKIEPEHPQFSLKTLIESLNINRDEIAVLGPPSGDRQWLASELMRPSATAEKWQLSITNRKTEIDKAIHGVKYIEAQSRHLEARSIALILRHALETPKQTAALITPDRNLAKRVKAELQRWNISIDDSAGEPLAQYGLADLTMRLLNAIRQNFSAASLVNLFTHQDCHLGFGREAFATMFKQFEIVVLRGYGGSTGIGSINSSFDRAFQSHIKKMRVHPLVQALTDEDWQQLHKLKIFIATALKPLERTTLLPLADQIQCIKNCLETLAPNFDSLLAENQSFAEVIYEIECEAFRHPVCTLEAAGIVISHALQTTPFRSVRTNQNRLAIYGVLEARLLPIDVVILGGLNEGKWPAQPDPGPWLNRSMRKIFSLQQPEREIGVSAHDFAQGFGYDQVYLSWSNRIDGVPHIPSRWILRLLTVLQAANINLETIQDQYWLRLATELDSPTFVLPFAKPKPTPPIAARPTNFSVSGVEKLIRDPYALYASKLLRLESLPKLDQDADAKLRGILFHEAINQWNKQNSLLPPEKSLELLLTEGRKIFAPFENDIEIISFWWPRFVKMATWLIDQEQELRKNIAQVHAEVEGAVSFDIGGTVYHLTARADRIDILRNSSARLIDYKTGEPPSIKQVRSGMSPQLPLEAAILDRSGYKEIGALKCSQMIYLKINGAKAGGKLIDVEADEGQTLVDLGNKHLNEFKTLLREYSKLGQPYYPRANMHLETDVSDFDHLSRYAEWILAAQL